MVGHMMRLPRFFFLVIIVLVIGIMLTALNVYELHRMQREHINLHHEGVHFEKSRIAEDTYDNRPIYWLYAKHVKMKYHL